MESLNSFLNDEISHIDFQMTLYENVVAAENMPKVLERLFSNSPNFIRGGSMGTAGTSDGYIYRFVDKAEYERLISGKPVESMFAHYSGTKIDVTTNPNLNFHPFARVRLKCDVNALVISCHKPEFSYYHLNQPSYSLSDVVSIDRLVGGDFLNVFSTP